MIHYIKENFFSHITRLHIVKVGKITKFKGKNIIIKGGEKIFIGDNCIIYDNSILIADKNCDSSRIVIGNNCHFNYGCYLEGMGELIIGNNTLVGPKVQIISSGHNFNDLNTLIIDQGLMKGKVKIGNNVWIGAGAIILPNVIIEDGSIIGAGAIVTKSVDANSIMVGNPAKCINKRI